MAERFIFSSLWLIFIILCGCSSWKNEVSLISLLGEMTDRESLSYFPLKQYTHRQFSSYNPASVSPSLDGWFENYDMSHFIRVEENNGRREFVMFDAEGPGALVRWWMTFYKAQNGVLRIYIDNDSLPAIIGSPDYLLSGSLLGEPPLAVSVQAGAPLGDEGRDYDHNFYIPIPFSNHCKITYECDSLVLRYDYDGIPVEKGYYWPDVFYNIGYRAYNKDIKVESFSMNALEEAKDLLLEAGDILLTGKPDFIANEEFEKLIHPGDSLVVEFGNMYNSIKTLMVELIAPDMPQALRSTVLKASFDGFQTIWTPIGEFFGTGYSFAPHQTWMNERAEDGKMYSYWVMPFRNKCLLKFINYGTEDIQIHGLAGLGSYNWNEKSMYFGASWHEYYYQRTVDENGMHYDLNFIDIIGKGVYVGDQITLFNNTWHWWGEGDEKIFVDGESFPSSFGTGSEDYYGYSFARQEAFSHPFICQPTGVGNMARGVTINMRHRSLDAIPFNTSLSSNIELWHWADIYMNYALTTFYYTFPLYEQNIVPDLKSVKRKVVLSEKDFETAN
jgi:D-arabinan exo alpha-(1,3)/(1,5)-arabinofuranosidase (non-reducing end)